MNSHTVALFGESEKGDFHLAYFLQSLDQIQSMLGHPPPHTKGLEIAIQSLLLNHHLIFFRVEEEGYSTHDYLQGLHFLQNRQLIPSLSALCLPGVSNAQILEMGQQICHIYKSILITTEADLYDYLTNACDKI